MPNATTIAAIEELERDGGTVMSGFWNGLTDGQQRAALAYRGDDTVGPGRQRLIDADSATRKTFPMARGLLDYFPDALAAVAQVSHIGNEKHNPGETMHHARGKSMDHADCIVRHLVGRGGFDGDTRESAALAWRALALLQEELEQEMALPLPRGARAS
ncbi:dATP/dGTP diphosphohydrolase domain-containing protein [Nitrobacteraceae bacterium UC4446_H13]